VLLSHCKSKTVAYFCDAEGKQRAAAQYKKKRLKPFHIERWDLAHRATEYDRWTTAKDFYDIEYEHVSLTFITCCIRILPMNCWVPAPCTWKGKPH
jgi:hypothetical protein